MTESPPIIDLTPLAHGGEAGVAAAVGAACRDWGFFQIVNHGIPEALIDKVWRQTAAFFDLPMAEKRQLLRSKDNPRGYYDRELTKNARDLKEVFDFGMEPYQDLPSDHPKNRLPVDGYNRWPAGQPAFKETLTAYYKACEGLGQQLMQIFCLGLGVPRDRLTPYFGADHTSFIRLNYYPLEDPLAPAESAGTTALGDMALHHHSDAGVLTILLQDDVGGLQCFAKGEWFDVTPHPGALVINLGDMMQLWSNDTYVAALHRVRPITDRPRYSLPFFFNPSYATDCAPLEPLAATQGARYRPVNWGHFRQARTDGDYADYGKEIQLEDFRLG